MVSLQHSKLQDDIIELDKNKILYIILGICAAVTFASTFVSKWVYVPPWMPLLSGVFILIGVTFHLVTHENFTYQSIQFKIMVGVVLLSGGITALLVLGISTNMLVDTIDYFSVGLFGIGWTTIALAISGGITLISFVILKLVARSEGFV